MIRTRYGGLPDNIYYDIDFHNSTESASEKAIPFTFKEQRRVDYLERSEDYLLSVVRFNIQTVNLPVFIPMIKSNQANPKLTVYQILLTTGAGTNLINLQWEPQDELATVPASPVVSQEYSEYYFCYSYQWWLDVINAQIAAVAGFGPNEYCFLQYDTSTANIKLTTTIEFYTGGYEISFNAPLKNLFSTFTYKHKNFSGVPYYKIEFPANGIPDPVYPYSLGLYIVTTFTSPVSIWNPISSIVFTSATLPVQPALVGSQLVYGTDIQKEQTGNNVTSVITDFQVNVSDGNFYKPSIEYIPVSQYRFIDMFGTGGMQNLDITVNWKDYYGNLHPMTLSNNCSGSIKLLFQKK